MTDFQLATKNTGLAGAIERDLLRRADDKSRDPFAECFSCGLGMTYRGSRFCSTRCREWFDAGNPSYTEQQEHNRRIVNAPGPWRLIAGPPGAELPHMPKAMRRGSVGFYIQCACCRREFESKGLRCCSQACERRYRDREENLRVMAEAGIEVSPKRKCEGCGNPIPKWRNGRKVSGATRFCSPKCSREAQTADTAISTSKRARSAHKSTLESSPQNVLDLARAAIEAERFGRWGWNEVISADSVRCYVADARVRAHHHANRLPRDLSAPDLPEPITPAVTSSEPDPGALREAA